MFIIYIPFNGPTLPINIINNLDELQNNVYEQLSQLKHGWLSVGGRVLAFIINIKSISFSSSYSKLKMIYLTMNSNYLYR